MKRCSKLKSHRHTPRRWRLLTALLLSGLAAQAPAQIRTCPDGPAPADVAAGNLGPAPAGNYRNLCFEVRNDLSFERREIAYSSIALPATPPVTDLRRLAVVRGGRHIAAQFHALSRWGRPLADNAAAVRWLEISLPVTAAANAAEGYELRIYDTPVAVSDPLALTVAETAGVWQVDAGAARFAFDPGQPALLQRATLVPASGPEVTVFESDDRAGPRLTFQPPGGGPITLGAQPLGALASDPGVVFRNGFEATVMPASTSLSPAQVTAGSFEVLRQGPVRALFAVRGYFVDPGGASRCSPGTTTPYEALGYTAVFSVFRGQADIDLEFEFRNECSDALSGPFTDELLEVLQVSWQWPTAEPASSVLAAGQTPLASGSPLRVVQRRGNREGGSWQRRAAVEIGGQSGSEAEFFDQPFVGLTNPRWLATATLPWMRFREPQALAGSSAGLTLEFVAAPLTVGEGKGLWNHARVSFAEPDGPALTQATALAQQQAAATERGLLARGDLTAINAAAVLPSLGEDLPSDFKASYLAWLNLLHEETVGVGGQFTRNATYGAQLWPDTGSADPFNVDAGEPNSVSSGMNYWDPAGVELLEFLRAGDPRFAWDFALPGYRTQLHAAYLNTGPQSHGTRAGLAVTSGGPGCELFQPPCTADGTGGGQWHRSAFGSDDYTYAMSAELGYALRPTLGLQERFAQAGRTIINRYDPAIPEGSREAFVNAINITRQVIQHLEMLANCAEFVPGAAGSACDQRLREIVDELARDNLAAGILCQGQVDFGAGLSGDIPGPPAPLPTACFTPQQFMQNALMLPFFHRYFFNYGDPPSGSVGRALAQAARVLYDEGLPQRPDGSLDPLGNWAAALDCQLAADGRSVVACQAAPDSDLMTAMGSHTRPHTVAMLLLGHEADPAVGLCQVSRQVLAEPGFGGQPNSNGSWDGVGHFNQAGWWKGVSQMLQSTVFAVGLADTCR